MKFLTLAAELLFAAGTASALHPAHTKQASGAPALSVDGMFGSPSSVGELPGAIAKRDGAPIYWDWFEQLLDHSDPSKGTFKQLYYYNFEYYAGPGSPIILNSPGENNATAYTGYVTNYTLAGLMAKEVGGAVVLLEHRYWGYSSPYQNLTTDNLQYLTLDNAIKDLTYFAHNVNFTHFDKAGTSRADKAPWVLTGCSYSGALSAWVHAVAPGTFWMHHCSSAVVQTIGDFWQYYTVVHDVMPKNCSTDYTKVIGHVEKVLRNGTDTQKQKLKKKFGFAPLSDEDFSFALMDGLSLGQNMGFSDQKYGAVDKFHQLCDYVENQWPNSTTPVPGPEGVGLCGAINGLSKWFKEIDIPGGCAGWGYKNWTKKDDIGCYFNSDFNSPVYRDTTVNNPENRQWQWMLCNEPFEYWRTGGAPPGQPRMVSYLITEEVWNKQCELYFPEVNGHKVGVSNGRTFSQINKLTGGWDNVNTTRLMWSNGERDPWRPATVSSPFRPQGMLASTPEAPVRMIPLGTHCSDMLLADAKANDGLMKVFQEQLDNTHEWIADFYKEKKVDWPLYGHH